MLLMWEVGVMGYLETIFDGCCFTCLNTPDDEYRKECSGVYCCIFREIERDLRTEKIPKYLGRGRNIHKGNNRG